jgi:hypothetical protein
MVEALLPMAKRGEIGEAIRVTGDDEEPFIPGIKDRGWMKPSDLEREHRIDRDAFRKARNAAEPKFVVGRLVERCSTPLISLALRRALREAEAKWEASDLPPF